MEVRLSGSMARRAVRGHLHNVAPTVFVQMIAIERETCILDVGSGNQRGLLFFVEGELYDAILGEVRGEEAAMSILAWDMADVETSPLPQVPPRSIELSLTHVLLEAMRRRDERGRDLPTPEFSVEPLFRVVPGLAGAYCIDLASGRVLAARSIEDPSFDLASACESFQELALSVVGLATDLGQDSAPEEVLVTVHDLLLFLRFMKGSRLLVLLTDPASTSIPAVHAGLRQLAGEGVSWLA